jgi:PHD/YefM family antitoxin component YafN of YafNO toxin-antitoxin module
MAAAALPSRPEALERLARTLPSVSATKLVAGMQKVSSAVMAHGAVVVTRHDEPTMVLMSIDRYLKLEQAAEPNLDALTRRFDDMFSKMQQPQAAQQMADAFAMTPDELADAAVNAAGRTTAAR